MQTRWIAFGMAAVAVVLGGCETVRDWTGRDEPAGEAEVLPEGIGATGDYEADLRKTVQTYLQSAINSAEIDRSRVIRRDPYYFREYVEYPNGPSNFDVQIIEQESRTAPYVANVDAPKVRYATRYHRKRSDAEADTNFLRDTGTETLTFEYRHGNWKRIGSLFVADRTEERVDGQWVAVQEAPQRAPAPEEDSSWLQRTWGRVTDIF